METEPRERVISSDETLADSTGGKLTVREGAILRLEGEHTGPVSLEDGGNLILSGSLQGALDVGSLSTATITGSLHGQVDIRIAGTLVVEQGGSVTGAVSNYGSFTNSGTRSGLVHGRQPDDRDGSTELPTARGQ